MKVQDSGTPRHGLSQPDAGGLHFPEQIIAGIGGIPDERIYRDLLAKSQLHPIRSDQENARLTQLLLQLDERDDLSPEEQTLAEMLTLLIEDYETRHYPLPHVSPMNR